MNKEKYSNTSVIGCLFLVIDQLYRKDQPHNSEYMDCISFIYMGQAKRSQYQKENETKIKLKRVSLVLIKHSHGYLYFAAWPTP